MWVHRDAQSIGQLTKELEQLRGKSDRKDKIYKGQGFGTSSREGIRRKEEKNFRAGTFHFMQSNKWI